MNDDLIQRLRDLADLTDYPSTMTSAATLLEQQSVEIARLRVDAAKYRLLLKGHIHGAGYGTRLVVNEVCPMFGDEKRVENLDGLLAAAVSQAKDGAR